MKAHGIRRSFVTLKQMESNMERHKKDGTLKRGDYVYIPVPKMGTFRKESDIS